MSICLYFGSCFVFLYISRIKFLTDFSLSITAFSHPKQTDSVLQAAHLVRTTSR